MSHSSRPDYALIRLRNNEPHPASINASDVLGLIELKNDAHAEYAPPRVFNPDSPKEPLTSTYSRCTASDKPRELNPRQQLTEAASICVMAQEPHRAFLDSLLITRNRISILRIDSQNVWISRDLNCQDKPGKFFAAIINLVLNAASNDANFNGLHNGFSISVRGDRASTSTSSIHQLPSPLQIDSTGPLKSALQDCVFGDGLMRGSQTIVPTTFALSTSFEDDGSERLLQVTISGPDQMTTAAPMKEDLIMDGISRDVYADGLTSRSSPKAKEDRTVPTASRGSAMFGRHMTRFHGESSGVDSALNLSGTVQISYESTSGPSEADVMHYLNACGLEGIPALVAAVDLPLHQDSTHALRELCKEYSPRNESLKSEKARRILFFEGQWKSFAAVDNIVVLLSALRSYTQSKLFSMVSLIVKYLSNLILSFN